MSYLMRSFICLILLFVIYEACIVLKRQINYEHFTESALLINKAKKKLKEAKEAKENQYKALGTPQEWYDFNDEGYSYQDPKYWKVPQPYQPVCYDEDDTSPAPIMTDGTDNLMFYKPQKGDKYTNSNMKFEQKPVIKYTTTKK
jgi:hypothetical protein